MLSFSRISGTLNTVRTLVLRANSRASGNSSPSGESRSCTWTGLPSATARPAAQWRLIGCRCQTTGIEPCCALNTSSSPSFNTTNASAASQSSQALSTMALRTGATSVGEDAITPRMLLLPVWYVSASSSSRVLACTSSNNRAFSMAMTAWSAKVWTSARCDRIEDRLHIRCRTADDVQHIGGCNLVFKRFLQLARLRLHLLEQPHVLDGDDGLVGEGLQQCDLLVREGFHRRPIHRKCPDGNTLAQHRNAKHGAISAAFLGLVPIVFGIDKDIGYMNNAGL